MSDYVIIYWNSPLILSNVYKHLVSQATDYNPANITQCPGVKGGLKNTFMISSFQDEFFEYKKGELIVKGLNGSKDINIDRSPHFKDTFIFDLGYEALFFAEEPMLMKATAPWFHSTSYQRDGGVTIGGEFDIGKWCRPLQMDVQVWKKEGVIHFTKGEPLYYVQFNTEKKIIFKKFNMTPQFQNMMATLIHDPRRAEDKFFGGLEKRYAAFNGSDYQAEMLTEIKTNLVSKDEASPSV
jgi:hypothetical protein